MPVRAPTPHARTRPRAFEPAAPECHRQVLQRDASSRTSWMRRDNLAAHHRRMRCACAPLKRTAQALAARLGAHSDSCAPCLPPSLLSACRPHSTLLSPSCLPRLPPRRAGCFADLYASPSCTSSSTIQAAAGSTSMSTGTELERTHHLGEPMAAELAQRSASRHLSMLRRTSAPLTAAAAISCHRQYRYRPLPPLALDGTATATHTSLATVRRRQQMASHQELAAVSAFAP